MPQSTQFLTNRPTRNERVSWNNRDWFVLTRLRKELKKQISELQLPTTASIMDYGCADLPYRHYFADSCAYYGADLPGNPNATIFINPDGSLPAENNSFDLVISTQVLEHVYDPEVYLSECSRVLKPSGRLLLTTHGIWPYHADPVDYWRWTGSGLMKAATNSQLEIKRFIGIGGLLAVAVQLFQEGSWWRLPKPLRNSYCFLMQRLTALMDHFYSEKGRKENAMVYLMIAEPAKIESSETTGE